MAYHFPDLLKEWDFDKNTLSPYNVKPKSSKIVFWICPNNPNHSYDMKISMRTTGNHGCPYCAGKRVSIDNCLATTHPELSKIWHHEKNSISMYDITQGSHKEVWWKCENNEEHIYKMAIYRKTGKQKVGCPYCSGDKINHTNCLATTHPHLIKEWHSKNKLSPYDVTYGKKIKVWWKCCKCEGEWEANILDRASKNSGCPYCNESKGEKTIKMFFDMNNINYIQQYEFDDLKGLGGGLLKFDFAIFDN